MVLAKRQNGKEVVSRIILGFAGLADIGLVLCTNLYPLPPLIAQITQLAFGYVKENRRTHRSGEIAASNYCLIAIPIFKIMSTFTNTTKTFWVSDWYARMLVRHTPPTGNCQHTICRPNFVIQTFAISKRLVKKRFRIQLNKKLTATQLLVLSLHKHTHKYIYICKHVGAQLLACLSGLDCIPFARRLCCTCARRQRAKHARSVVYFIDVTCQASGSEASSANWGWRRHNSFA